MGFSSSKYYLVSFAVGLSLVYVPIFNGAATSTRWAYLAISLPILLFATYRKTPFTCLHLVGCLFFVWSCLQLLWTSNVYDGIDNLIKLTVISIGFVIGSQLNSLKYIFVGLGIGLIVQTPFQLFVNYNIYSELALIVFVGLIVYEYVWLALCLLPAMLMYQTRSVLFAGALVGLSLLWTKSRFLTALLSLYCIVISVGSIALGYKIASIETRFELWRDTISGINLFGNGIGSFWTSYPYLSNWDTLLIRSRFAHNDLLQIVFEQGIIGGFLACLFVCIALIKADIERYILIAFIGISCVAFPFYLPVSSFVAALVCGHAARNRIDLRLFFAKRRISLFARNS
jgi:O-antigen ligase